MRTREPAQIEQKPEDMREDLCLLYAGSILSLPSFVSACCRRVASLRAIWRISSLSHSGSIRSPK
jgi:hypothetical protein